MVALRPLTSEPQYCVRHYRWYAGPTDRHFVELGRYATIAAAKAARVVSGDLVTHWDGRLVEPLTSWLWFWEKVKTTCYARTVWRNTRAEGKAS